MVKLSSYIADTMQGPEPLFGLEEGRGGLPRKGGGGGGSLVHWCFRVGFALMLE